MVGLAPVVVLPPFLAVFGLFLALRGIELVALRQIVHPVSVQLYTIAASLGTKTTVCVLFNNKNATSKNIDNIGL